MRDRAGGRRWQQGTGFQARAAHGPSEPRAPAAHLEGALHVAQRPQRQHACLARHRQLAAAAVQPHALERVRRQRRRHAHPAAGAAGARGSSGLGSGGSELCALCLLRQHHPQTAARTASAGCRSAPAPPAPVGGKVPQADAALVIAAGHARAVVVHAPDGPAVAAHVLQAGAAVHVPQPAGGVRAGQRVGPSRGRCRKSRPAHVLWACLHARGTRSASPPSHRPDAAVAVHVGAAAGGQRAALQLRAADVVAVAVQAAPRAAPRPPVGLAQKPLPVGVPPAAAQARRAGRPLRGRRHDARALVWCVS